MSVNKISERVPSPFCTFALLAVLKTSSAIIPTIARLKKMAMMTNRPFWVAGDLPDKKLMESLSGSKGWKRIGKLKKHSKTPIYSDLPGHLVKIMCMCCSVVIGRKWAVEGFVNVSVFSALTGSKTAGYLDIKHGLPNVTVYLLPLSVSLSAWLPFRLSVCLSVRLSVCLFICLSDHRAVLF